MSELGTARDTIEVLKKINGDLNYTISSLEKENIHSKEALAAINKRFNENRITYEEEKFRIFKEHKVKSWRRD